MLFQSDWVREEFGLESGGLSNLLEGGRVAGKQPLGDGCSFGLQGSAWGEEVTMQLYKIVLLQDWLD